MENLRADIILNVSSFLLGEPKDLRMQNNKALKDTGQIQTEIQ